MTHYMNQDLFNQTVMTLAAMTMLIEHPDNTPAKTLEAQQVLDKAIQAYLNYYTEDDFLSEAKECASTVIDWIRKGSGSYDEKWETLILLNGATQRFKPNGKRKLSAVSSPG